MSTDIVTFGCRLNAYESEAIRARAAEAGLGDAVIVNTCAVTAEAAAPAAEAKAAPAVEAAAAGAVAEAEGHHPDLFLSWGKVDVKIWTHKVDGLTESDFVLAAKIGELF